jgi:Uma2 family endonuclease
VTCAARLRSCNDSLGRILLRDKMQNAKRYWLIDRSFLRSHCMATSTAKNLRGVEYPTSDGQPMAETDFHRNLMFATILQLSNWFTSDPRAYVSGNLLIFYEQGNKRKHVAPDVFVVRGVPNKLRENFLIWEEGKGPDAVIELTSKSTRKEDTVKKFNLYQDILRVPEYFLCDPRAEYLKPPLQGFRLHGQAYKSIYAVKGRLPSEVLGLHLEREEIGLKLFDPQKGQYVLTAQEELEREHRHDKEILKSSEEEIADLRRKVEELQRRIKHNR